MVRESARSTSCTNNLRQIGMAFHNIHSSFRHFPSNGWGYQWHGDPDFGIGWRQPGGWIYQVLPFVEQEPLARMGRGIADPALKKTTLGEVSATPLDLFMCPSRRSGSAFPYSDSVFPLINCEVGLTAAKTDYAVCAGDSVIAGAPGPDSIESFDEHDWIPYEQATGVCFVLNETSMRDIRDGTSCTLLVGEKCLSVNNRMNGETIGDDQSMFIGDDADNRRWAYKPPVSDWQDEDIEAFGGPHPNRCLFVLCDGSVKAISNDVEEETFRSLGNRMDGKVISPASCVLGQFGYIR